MGSAASVRLSLEESMLSHDRVLAIVGEENYSDNNYQIMVTVDIRQRYCNNTVIGNHLESITTETCF